MERHALVAPQPPLHRRRCRRPSPVGSNCCSRRARTYVRQRGDRPINRRVDDERAFHRCAPTEAVRRVAQDAASTHTSIRTGPGCSRNVMTSPGNSVRRRERHVGGRRRARQGGLEAARRRPRRPVKRVLTRVGRDHGRRVRRVSTSSSPADRIATRPSGAERRATSLTTRAVARTSHRTRRRRRPAWRPSEVEMDSASLARSSR